MKKHNNNIGGYVKSIQMKFLTMAKNLKYNLKERILRDIDKVETNSTGIAFFELMNGIEEILYRRKIMKVIMPFVEYILLFYMCIYLIFDILKTWSSDELTVFSVIPLILCGLCTVKRKYGITFLGLFYITCKKIYLIIQIYNSGITLYSVFTFFYLVFLIDIIIMIGITLKMISLWYCSKSGLKVRYWLAGLLTTGSKKRGDRLFLEIENILNKDKNSDLRDLNLKKEYKTLDDEVMEQLKKNIQKDYVATNEIQEEKLEEIKE